MITPFHAQYYANELLHKKSYSSNERISSSLFDAALAINPIRLTRPCLPLNPRSPKGSF